MNQARLDGLFRRAVPPGNRGNLLKVSNNEKTYITSIVFKSIDNGFDDRFLLLLETSTFAGAFGTQQEAELRCVVRAFLLSLPVRAAASASSAACWASAFVLKAVAPSTSSST